MKSDLPPSSHPKERQRRYAALAKELSTIGWISEGYVQDRGPGAGGPHYQWSRKVRAKTVSVALSQEQYLALGEAIENWKQFKSLLKEMQQLSRQQIFETLPGLKRRKRLSNKVLGLN